MALAVHVLDVDALGTVPLQPIPVGVHRGERRQAPLLPLPVGADRLGRPHWHGGIAVLEPEDAGLLPHGSGPSLAVAKRHVRWLSLPDDAHHGHRRRHPRVHPLQRLPVRPRHARRLDARVRLHLAQQRLDVGVGAPVVLSGERVACTKREHRVVAKDALVRQQHVRGRHLPGKVSRLGVGDDEAGYHLGTREQNTHHLGRASERRRNGHERFDLGERLVAKDVVEAVEQLQVAERVPDQQRLPVPRRVCDVVQYRRQVGAQLVLGRRQPPVVRHAE
mmetsp:Transcript_7754/g.24758  ORF Transcript_7754/g.24758 Transcript_7754/m.24758 type:complete len:277 (-) Transcript_7754:214-1044(-)